MPFIPTFTRTFFDRNALVEHQAPSSRAQPQTDQAQAGAAGPSGSNAPAEPLASSTSPRGARLLRRSLAQQDAPIIFRGDKKSLDADFQKFMQNGSLARCVAQYRELLDRITGFVDAHATDPKLKFQPTPAVVAQTKRDLEMLKERVSNLAVDHFSTHKTELYGHIKELFHQLDALLSDPKLPLQRRMDAVTTISDKMRTCSGGIQEALNDSVYQLSLTGVGIRGTAFRFKKQLVKDMLTKHIASAHAGQYVPGNEVHLANQYLNHFAEKVGLPEERDLFLSVAEHITQDQLDQCEKKIISRLNPSTLSKRMAEDYLNQMREDLEDRIHQEQPGPGHQQQPHPLGGVLTGELLGRVNHLVESFQKTALIPNFGEVSSHSVFRLEDDYSTARLVKEPTLIAKELMRNLRNDGLVDYDDTLTLTDDAGTGAIKMLGGLFWRDCDGKCTELKAEELLALSPQAVLTTLAESGVPAQERGTVLRNIAQGVLEAVQSGELAMATVPASWLQAYAVELERQEENGPAQQMQPLAALAAMSNNCQVLQTLQEKRVDFNAADDHGMTPVMFAAEHGCLEALAVLINAGANVDARNGGGRTAALLAAQHDQNLALLVLLFARADLNAQDTAGNTALMLAAKHNHLTMLTRLLAHEDVDPGLADHAGNTALMLAARQGHRDALVHMLNTGRVSPFHRDVHGNTALMLAARHGQVDILSHLLAFGGTYRDLVNADRNSAVSLAAKHGHLQALIRLRQHGADFDEPTKLAAQRGDADALRLLLEAGANPNAATVTHGVTAVMYAAANGRLDAVHALINGGADLNLKDVNGLTAAMYAATGNHIAALEALIEGGADLNVQDKRGVSATIHAALNNHVAALKVLIEAGADLNVQDDQGFSAVICAAYNGEVAALEVLIEGGADLNLQDDHDMSAAMHAAQNGRIGALQTLVASGADLNLTSTSGLTAAMVAAQRGHAAALEVLVEAGANLDLQDEQRFSAVMHAVHNGHIAALEALAKGNPNLDLQDIQGTSAAMYAAYNGDVAALKVLIEGNANLNVQDSTGLSAAMYAAMEGHAGALRVLVEAGADLKLQDAEGLSAAMHAERHGHTEALQVLVEGGANSIH